MKRARIIPSASRFRHGSASGVLPRRGAATRRKPSSARRSTRFASSRANPSLSSRTDEAAVNSSLVTDLGLGPEVWLFLSLLGCVTLFFKFSRFWSVRNLDLLLLFVLAPGMMLLLVGQGRSITPWSAYIWLFLGSGLWLVRCCARPGSGPPAAAGAEPECLGVTVPVAGRAGPAAGRDGEPAGRGRGGAEPGRAIRPRGPIGRRAGAVATRRSSRSSRWPEIAPLPSSLKRELPQVIVSRVLASLAHVGLVLGLLAIGWRHFERPLTGMAMAACYLLLPYTRMALVDSGQLIPAALIVAAVFWHLRPAVAGALIGLAAGWIPACLGLIALWCGFYRGRGAVRFIAVALAVVIGCASWATGCRAWENGPAPWAPAASPRSACCRSSSRRSTEQLLGEHRLQLSSPGADRSTWPW